MAFKLGSENRKINYNNPKNTFDDKDDASVPGTPVIRKELAPGVDAEANIDGSIYIGEHIVPGSEQERKVLMHEMKHIVDMKTGKLSYTDNSITWMGEKHVRKDGLINYNGEWKQEGDPSLPWEGH
jgi:hypothetical protein